MGALVGDFNHDHRSHLDYRENGVTTNRAHRGLKRSVESILYKKINLRMDWMILQ